MTSHKPRAYLHSMQELVQTICTDFSYAENGVLRHAAIPHEIARFESSEDDSRVDAHEAVAQVIYYLYHASDAGAVLDYFSPAESQARMTAYDMQDDAFVDALKSAYGVTRYVSEGWRALDDGAPRFHVEKGGLTLFVSDEDIARRDGETCALRLPTAYPYRSPGFIGFCGAQGPLPPDAETVRLYVSLEAQGAPVLLSRYAAGLSRRDLYYSFKVCNSPVRFQRFDAAVFYVERKDVETFLAEWFAFDKTGCNLVDAASPFVKQMDAGLCLAEEPAPLQGVKTSLGVNRSRLVAEAVVRALELHGELKPNVLLSLCNSVFAANQVHIATPYLSYSWLDEYDALRSVA